MKRIKGFVKENIKLFIGIIVGGIIFGGGVYAATVAANSVSYSNSSSGIAATNVQGAIDALYSQTSSLKSTSEAVGKGLGSAAFCMWNSQMSDKSTCLYWLSVGGSRYCGDYGLDQMATCTQKSSASECYTKVCSGSYGSYPSCVNETTSLCKSYCRNNSSCEAACINANKWSECP